MKSHGFFSMLVRFKQSKGDKSLLDNHVNEREEFVGKFQFTWFGYFFFNNSSYIIYPKKKKKKKKKKNLWESWNRFKEMWSTWVEE